jgi:hypothetical protein
LAKASIRGGRPVFAGGGQAGRFPSPARNNFAIFDLMSNSLTWLNVAQLLANLLVEDEIGRSRFVQCQSLIVQKPLRMMTVLRAQQVAGRQGASCAVWPCGNGRQPMMAT